MSFEAEGTRRHLDDFQEKAATRQKNARNVRPDNEQDENLLASTMEQVGNVR